MKECRLFAVPCCPDWPMSWINPKPARDISLDDYGGTPIPNHIDPDSAPGLLKLAMQINVVSSATQILPATGRYNCHGLVFGSRRTNIPPVGIDFDIEELLRRDRYRQSTKPQIGDVIIYRRANGEIDHSGIVCYVETIGKEAVVKVWSAWGSLGEFIHHQFDTPYDGATEYWRLA